MKLEHCISERREGAGPGRGNSKCEGPEEGMCLMCSRKSQVKEAGRDGGDYQGTFQEYLSESESVGHPYAFGRF